MTCSSGCCCSSCRGKRGATGPTGPGGVGPTGPSGSTGPTGPNIAGAAPPLQSVQYDNAGNLGGSDDVAISNDADEVLVVGINNVGPIPVTGNFRIIAGPLDGNGFIARFRSGRTNPADERDVGAWYCYSTTGTSFGGEKTVFGLGGWNDGAFPTIYQPELCPDVFFLAFNSEAEILFTTPTPDNNQNAVTFVQFDQAGPVAGWDHRRVCIVQRYTNFLLFPVDYGPVDDALGNGEGVFVWGKALFAPTTNPTAGQIIGYVSPVDAYPYARTSTGAIVPLYAASAATELAADQTTSSDVFATLLSANVTTQSGVIDIVATLCGLTTTQAGVVRVAVDGTPIANGGANVPVLASAVSAAISKRVTGLSAGAHTVTLEWRVVTGGTFVIRPVTQVDTEHATLLVRPSS